MPLTVAVSWFPKSVGTPRDVTLGDDATAADLLDALGVTPDTVLVVRGTIPVPLDAPLTDGDALRIVHTVSGG